MAILTPVPNDNDHIRGGENASIEIVEYGDYQCPHCGRAYPILKKIQKNLGPDLKFVFRNFPLSEMHPQAFSAALAAEAAGLQCRFWEMHDLLFESQGALNWLDLQIYAVKAGLDVLRFQNDINSESLSRKVRHDFKSGVQSGVNATPTLFINGLKYNGAWNEQSLGQYLEILQQGGAVEP